MNENRQIRYIELSDIPDVEAFFERHTGIDMSAEIDEKYDTAVTDGRKAIDSSCRIAMVYDRLGIEERDNDSVLLSSGHRLTGKMVSRAMEHANEMYLFVMMVDGYSDFTADDIMVEYFGDTWATSYVEAAQAMFAKEISGLVEREGLKRTHVWSPGQATFGLQNQRVLFDILSPEDIGCTLTRRMMMVPVKAESGVIGVMPPDAEESLKPCDYCTYKATCPGSNRGCASL
ncbi:MAG: hypothetical protein J5804_06535 [Eggerthellaceae bacterium]|nr:hypothetical protein [Eggerthellaceae bacterium]